MTKPDEIRLFNALKRRADGDLDGRGMAASLGISEKVAYNRLMKWEDRGWWEYGVSAFCGWFTKLGKAVVLTEKGWICGEIEKEEVNK
jgi:hypothetical protein